MSEQKITGIDLAKRTFIFSVSMLMANPQKRSNFLATNCLTWLVQQPEMTVAVEACGVSHHWAREISKFVHDVILLPAQHVKSYQRCQKMIITTHRNS
ncbi:transposase [Escherichia coli]|nr:transposase [Escherichia coli]